MPKEYQSSKRLKSQERTRRQIWTALSTLLQIRALYLLLFEEISENFDFSGLL